MTSLGSVLFFERAARASLRGVGMITRPVSPTASCQLGAGRTLHGAPARMAVGVSSNNLIARLSMFC